jgi:hypothetical protein
MGFHLLPETAMLNRIQSPLLAMSIWVVTACGVAQAQSGLRLDPEQTQSFKARVHLLAADASAGSRLLGAQLLGDYYPLSGGNGLRLSGGLLLGPTSLLGTGLAPATSVAGLGFSQRSLRGSTDEPVLQQPYLGVGYSQASLREGWGFSADLGLAVSGGNGLRLNGPTAFAQSLDDSVRRLQWTPVLQVGLSYRF